MDPYTHTNLEQIVERTILVRMWFQIRQTMNYCIAAVGKVRLKGTRLERVTGKISDERKNSPTDFQRAFPIFGNPARVFSRVTVFTLQIVPAAHHRRVPFGPVNETLAFLWVLPSVRDVSHFSCAKHGQNNFSEETKVYDSLTYHSEMVEIKKLLSIVTEKEKL